MKSLHFIEHHDLTAWQKMQEFTIAANKLDEMLKETGIEAFFNYENYIGLCIRWEDQDCYRGIDVYFDENCKYCVCYSGDAGEFVHIGTTATMPDLDLLVFMAKEMLI